jgi:hypothetical protein
MNKETLETLSVYITQWSDNKAFTVSFGFT